MTLAGVVFVLTLLLLPSVLASIDLAAALRARKMSSTQMVAPVIEDFEVLVPIYGHIRYLENVDYLASYGDRVILCTTTEESEEFNESLTAISRRYGFRVFRGTVARAREGTQRRATSGTVRDRLVRDAHAIVTAPFVVCLDADTTTVQPLGVLVAEMDAAGYDLVSVKLVPSNRDTLLARIQVHEYRLAMMLRRVLPWLVSGACHAGRTEVHRQAMQLHSLFFQGNDVELGVLADTLGYRVGHVPFEVPTTVPDRLRPWLRQRLAWAGGEVRLFLMNPQLARRHPMFWAYGGLVTLAGFPFRWLAIAHLGLVLLATVVVYWMLLLYLHRGHWDRWLLIVPFYAALSSLLIAPLGLLWYGRMAVADRNLGLIRVAPRRRRRTPRHARAAVAG